MDSILDNPPASVSADLASLNGALDHAVPKQQSKNLLIATWNIRKFGDLNRQWLPSGSVSPKRDFRALIAIIKIIERFDVIAIQEVTGNLRALRDTIRYLGKGWSFLMTDVTAGYAGNGERLAFLFNNKRVQPSGLACEIVVPPEWIHGKDTDAVLRKQFARTPYAVSFRAGTETFILMTAHIDYGKKSADRVTELKGIAAWMADWASRTHRYHQNLLVLGDFNIDRKDDLLWQAFISTRLYVPNELHQVRRSIFIKEGEDPRTDKFYDQIAWFAAGAKKQARLQMRYRSGGGFDFLPHVYTDTKLSKQSLSHRLSDHYPLWVEFARGI